MKEEPDKEVQIVTDSQKLPPEQKEEIIEEEKKEEEKSSLEEVKPE
eukprot:CAMPEP_0170551496 /NCGR_PEP_ID=MMETSP0211-20121228/9485_1 /TAXON_ID=311385 /ORGANISM="Pseudokeronopsis sp., Strain OXSARD2" /LENGTH=45 /DNA_ID= /DNA_START= /DNA_END= /DNA_ORIENTATION=